MNLVTGYTVRRAGLDDIPALIELRAKMFATFVGDEGEIAAMNEYSSAYFKEQIEANQFMAWVAEDEGGEVVACAALSFYYLPPKPFNLAGKYGYISSMYTEEEHRRKGLARKLLQKALDCAREEGLTMVKLHATEAGAVLYESAGFKKWNEMALVVE